ncbi:hypothetical protein SH580_06150 [Coraliomargarita algicola]|uniref:PEP-CTERM protein-sorting domain-containing protein n=1 Tax=Coraliomargarita algicola TaxID=3092156 RepID=A0ABZ0RQ60_9BACT|nr:hypothetical protein [Coraliomargarita sp. J2-16]WPJ97288.1 hypothetical protein SH580_06150 [Coraliomargarita sp. J2-16]
MKKQLSIIAMLAGLGGSLSAATLFDDFTGVNALDNWTHTVILDNGNTGTQNTSTWQVNGSDQLELVTTNFDAIEQHAYIRSGASVAVGEEAQITLTLPISGNNANDSFGIYVGGTAPVFNVRQDFLTHYNKSGSASSFSTGFNGTTAIASQFGTITGADTLFIARTATDTYEVGYYTGATRTIVSTRVGQITDADVVGIFADTRANGTLSSIDSFQIIPEPGSFALLAGLTGLLGVMLRRRSS